MRSAPSGVSPASIASTIRRASAPRIARGVLGALLAEPAREARNRRQSDEGLQPRQFAPQVLDHLLDEEIAETDAGEAGLRVGDRIEHRRRRRLGGERHAVGGQQRLDRFGNRPGQRDFDEDQRLVDQRRMEEGVEPAVGRREAAAQLLPGRDLVHRLIADDLFQDVGGRRPFDAAQHEEAAIEPGRRTDGGNRGRSPPAPGRDFSAASSVSRILTSASVPPRRVVEPADQLLPRRLGAGAQVGGVRGVGRLEEGARGLLQAPRGRGRTRRWRASGMRACSASPSASKPASSAAAVAAPEASPRPESSLRESSISASTSSGAGRRMPTSARPRSATLCQRPEDIRNACWCRPWASGGSSRRVLAKSAPRVAGHAARARAGGAPMRNCDAIALSRSVSLSSDFAASVERRATSALASVS